MYLYPDLVLAQVLVSVLDPEWVLALAPESDLE
jgi:hypothetical protein